MPSRPARLRLLALVAGAGLTLLGLTGCVDADPPASTAASQETPGEAAVSNTEPRTKPTATKALKVEAEGGDEVAVVKAFSADGADGVDRFDISFTSPISGYSLRYVKALTEEPSGKKVKLAGEASLLLVVENATMDSTPYVTGSTKPTKFSSGLAFAPRMLAISEVELIGDHEATLSVGIGVSEKNLPFTATLQDDGTRLTVDIAQP